MGVQERRAREKEGIREEILDAARTLFVKEGYESVSIRKIAEKIEYSPGTIYLYFQDKAEILFEICTQTFAKLERNLSAIFEDNADTLECLRRGLRVYIQFGLENPNHYMITFVLPGPPRPKPEDFMKCTVGGRCFGFLVQGVENAMRDGKIKSGDVNEIAQALWAGMHGVTTLLISCGEFPFVEHNRLVDRVIDTLIEGIRTR